MLVTVAMILTSIVALVLLLALLFLLGMRGKWPFVLDAVRAINRRVFNPRQMRSAGQAGAWASIVRHTGRRSGDAYETPVVALAIDEGFAIVLPYGTRANWVRNVLAAGEATLVTDGRIRRVGRPEVVPIAAIDAHLDSAERRSHRIFGVDRALVLRAAGDPD